VLTGDNPIVVEDLNKMFAFKSKLIFPISKTQIVVYSPDSEGALDLPPEFSTKLSMVVYAQSQRYLVGANREYMRKVVQLYSEIYGFEKLGSLRGELFEHI